MNRGALTTFLLCSSAPLLLCLPAAAQDQPPPTLRLGGVMPAGVRASVTEAWGAYDFDLTNLTGEDRTARVVMFYEGQPDVQYGRDVWVPARATINSWMLVGPAPAQESATKRELQVLLYDRTDGTDRLILPPGEGKVRARGVIYKKRDIYTALLLDETRPPDPVFSQMPSPETRDDEAVHLVRTFRAASNLSELVNLVRPGPLPPTAEAFDGVDQFVLASGRISRDPVGVRALRRWLERGGRLWVMLDRVEPDVLAPLLGDALDFTVVDRVGLTTTRIEAAPNGQGASPPEEQTTERPVDFVRVLLPPGERAPHTVNGWPAWFSRPVGRGKVVFTTLGPRGWYRPRRRLEDGASPYREYPALPVALAPLKMLTNELAPAREEEDLSRADWPFGDWARAPARKEAKSRDAAPAKGGKDKGAGPAEEPFHVEAFQPELTAEIGYSVVGRGTVALVFGGFLLAALALGLLLRRARRAELLGWLGPAAALGAAAVFLTLGESSRRATPPTLAVTEVVDAVPGADEAPVRGLMAVYRPDAGPAEAGVEQGGLFEVDASGLDGQTRTLLTTDQDAWRWDRLALPAGVRFAPFRATAPTGRPLTAVARLGPDGLDGRLAAGPFADVGDALLVAPNGRRFAVRMGADGAFRVGAADILPPDQYLTGAVLTDRQQRRQKLYREFLKRPPGRRTESRTLLLAWADPVDLHFSTAPGARTVGNALLIVPLRLERPAAGERLTVPGPLVACRRVEASAIPSESHEALTMHLRFELPPEATPLRVERARLTARINAPSRRVTVRSADGDPVELLGVDSPIDRIEAKIDDGKLLRPDDRGGLNLELSVSKVRKGDRDAPPESQNERWTLENLELEVIGSVIGDK
jgi:hypothetical protein